MQIVKIQLFPWDRPIYADPLEYKLNKNDLVLFRYESGPELGQVVGFEDVDIEKHIKANGELFPVLRLANTLKVQMGQLRSGYLVMRRKS